jgi:hypothetical protein
MITMRVWAVGGGGLLLALAAEAAVEELGVALAGPTRAVLAADSLLLGHNPAHEARWAAVGEPGHVDAGFGDDDLGGALTDP